MKRRAVYIEVANSLETYSFISALRRFICRQGSVREIRCDRGTNFIGTEAELKKAIGEMDDQEIKAELLRRGSIGLRTLHRLAILVASGKDKSGQ